MSSYREELAKNFIVDEEIKEYIKREERDFRICTTCSGPVMMPTDVAPPKPADIEISLGENSLFISELQAMYTRRIHKSMLDTYLWMLEGGMYCGPDNQS